MKIDLLAIETSGPDPKLDEILEWCVGSYDSETGRITGDSGILRPAGVTISEAVQAIHLKSGLFSDMAKAEPKTFPLPVSCHGRVLWAADFAKGFLPASSPWQHATNGTDLVRVARWAKKAPQWDPASRAEAKVKFMAEALACLVGIVP